MRTGRARHKEWKNRRAGWTRRAVWYGGGNLRIRLKLTDMEAGEERSVFYPDNDAATAGWEAFIGGSSPSEVLELRERGG